MPLRSKHIISFLFFFMIGTSLVGQKDSLLTILKNEESVAAKHKLAGNLYWTYLYKDTDFSDSITTYAIQLAKDAKNDSLICGSLHMKATVKLVKAEYDSSFFYINQNHAIAEKNNFIKRTASNYALEGLLFYYKGEYNKSLEKNFAALKIQKEIGAVNKQLKALNNIGIAYERLGENTKAIEYYDQAFVLTPEEDSYGKASLLNNISAVQTNIEEIEKSEKSLLKAKSLLKPGEHISLLNDIDIGLTKVYQRTDRLDNALSLANEVMTRAVDTEDYFRQVRVSELTGSLLLDKKNYAEAIVSLEHALDLSYEKDIGESLMPIYGKLRTAYEKIGRNDLALVASDSLLSKRKSLFDIEKRSITEELDLQYQTAIKDQELQESKLANTRKTHQRNLAIAGFLLLLTAGAFLWQRIKSKRLEEQKVDIIQKKRIEDLEKERKILSMSSMLEGQEKERYRIAQDLHDGLGGLLASVKAHFSTIEGEIKQLEKLNVFDKAQKMMDNACDEVRRISHNLMPPILTTQGLPNALRNLVADYVLTHDLNISIDIQRMENRLSINKEIVLYRICQELLNNINKYAKATEVELSLYGLDDNVQLIVEDNGVGFDQKKVTPGLGLISMQSRVEMLGGNVDIDTMEQKGTTISISIPK